MTIGHTRFYDAASGLLTRDAFNFMVEYQLRNALRTQEFLTLVVVIGEREWRELVVAADEWIMKEIARLIRSAVRSTDLLSRTADGMLCLLLVGIDLERANAVIERLHDHMRRYAANPSLLISIGAACCPTHSVSADELLRKALASRAVPISRPQPAPPATPESAGT
jgi:diguanylate cyclase (GGDEF)-like protein